MREGRAEEDCTEWPVSFRARSLCRIDGESGDDDDSIRVMCEMTGGRLKLSPADGCCIAVGEQSAPSRIDANQ